MGYDEMRWMLSISRLVVEAANGDARCVFVQNQKSRLSPTDLPTLKAGTKVPPYPRPR